MRPRGCVSASSVKNPLSIRYLATIICTEREKRADTPVSAPIAGRRAMRQEKGDIHRPPACMRRNGPGHGVCPWSEARLRSRRISGVARPWRGRRPQQPSTSRAKQGCPEGPADTPLGLVRSWDEPMRPQGWRAHGLADALMMQAQCALNAVPSHVHPELHARPQTLGASAWSADQVFDKFDAFRPRMANRYSTLFLVLFSDTPF